MPQKIVEIHAALESRTLGHAFGGALALAWCTEHARGTIDIDLNVFIVPERLDDLIAAMPPDIVVHADQRAGLVERGQGRLWWGGVPVDVFLNTTPFHRDVASRVRWERFAGAMVPFIACRDLAVFKAFYGRTQDWADLEAMQANGSLDIDSVAGVLVRYVGGSDPRLARLLALGQSVRQSVSDTD